MVGQTEARRAAGVIMEMIKVLNNEYNITLRAVLVVVFLKWNLFALLLLYM